ncbi:MAG TPA: PIN domain-containing protein [Vicinamibacteria bacterium]
MIHLDANFLIRGLVPETPQATSLRGWLLAGEAVGMSTVAWAEFLCGPVAEPVLERAALIVAERVPLLEEDADVAAKLFNASGRRRRSLADCLIVATALRSAVPLATTNLADFRRFEKMGLRLAR